MRCASERVCFLLYTWRVGDRDWVLPVWEDENLCHESDVEKSWNFN